MAAAILLSCGLALAATPSGGAHFAGKGKFCGNNAQGHTYTDCIGTDPFSFRTSADGGKVTHFKAKIGPLYCGGATNTISFEPLTVSAGAFRGKFTEPQRSHGEVTATVNVTMHGSFLTAKKAKVTYRLLIRFTGSPASEDCGAQVRGIAKAG
ncbi:MAG: hypothetical protein H0X42_07555 [Solirubrobacterales bacterium]|nr:hypothetical protein [Solirubrobacterales bacterium]